eukprot:17721-Heterococcus_DN1.PRE.2
MLLWSYDMTPVSSVMIAAPRIRARCRAGGCLTAQQREMKPSKYNGFFFLPKSARSSRVVKPWCSGLRDKLC